MAVVAAALLQPAVSASAATALPPKGQFTSECAYDHRLADDPIVAPNVPGGSHLHDFLANTSTDAHSTYESLRSAGTSCERLDDTAAYWLPSLRFDGVLTAPRVTRAYYRSGVSDVRTVKPFPAGLRVIAGNSKATAAQSLSIASWACSVIGDEIEQADVPTCPEGAPLRLRIVFPDCWNGRDLDAADHKSHMAYSSSGRCPSTHPVAVPKLTLSTRYWITGGQQRVALTSGGVYSGHADFFNGWKQTTLDSLVTQCMKTGIDCSTTGGPGPFAP